MKLTKEQYEAIKATFDELPSADNFVISNGKDCRFFLTVEIDSYVMYSEERMPIEFLDSCGEVGSVFMIANRKDFTTSYEDSIYAIT